MFHNPNYSTKQKERALINGFVHNHDLICICKNPAYHCLLTLSKQLGPELNQQEKQQIQQCLGTTTTDNADGVAEDHGLEDLEKLFAEDPTEEDTG